MNPTLWTCSSKQSVFERRTGIFISIRDSLYHCSGMGRSSIQIADNDGVKHFRVNGNMKKNLEYHNFECECSIMLMKFQF